MIVIGNGNAVIQKNAGNENVENENDVITEKENDVIAWKLYAKISLGFSGKKLHPVPTFQTSQKKASKRKPLLIKGKRKCKPVPSYTTQHNTYINHHHHHHRQEKKRIHIYMY